MSVDARQGFVDLFAELQASVARVQAARATRDPGGVAPGTPNGDPACAHEDVVHHGHGEQWGDVTTSTCQACGWVEVG